MRRSSIVVAICLVSVLVAGVAVGQKEGSGTRLIPPGPFVPTPTGPSVFCSTPGASIPDNDPGGVSDSMVIGSTGSINDLDVSINTTHTWVGDLRFTLEHDDTGTTVVFFDRPGEPDSFFGCSGDDIDATIDDEAATGVEDECGDGVPTIDGSFIGGDPTDPTLMTAYDGEDVSGSWTMTVTDNAGGDTGTLNEWCVIVDAPAGCVLGATAPTTVQAGKLLSVDMSLMHNRPATVSVPFWVWVEDAAGNVIASKTTRPVTMEYGQHIQRRTRIKIPPLTAIGQYFVHVRVQEMRQGEADASQPFQVVP